MRIELIAALGLVGGSIAWWLATAVLAVRQSRGRVHEETGLAQIASPVGGSVGVSVIVPVASPAPHLGACVGSLLAMRYSPLEILLVAEVGDVPAIRAIERESAAAPARIRSLIVHPAASPNPKVGLQAAAVEAATHDLLLFTDDNAISPRSRVQAHLQRMDEGFALVSAPVVGIPSGPFWGQVDAAFMNGYFARLQLAGDVVGASGVLGKSMLVRRSDVERSGGILATGGTLSCEDAALQKRVAAVGGRTALCREPMQQRLDRPTPAEVWGRHRRWFFCRWNQRPAVLISEVVFSAAGGALAGAYAARALGWPWWNGALAVALALLAIELAFLQVKRWPIGARYPLVWIVREALVLPLCVASVLGGSVVWRQRRNPLTGIRSP